MSLLGKKWVIQNEDQELNIIKKLLLNRNLETEEEQQRFFNEQSDDVHDPLLLKDIDKAVSRIKQAIADQEKILVFGDYDVDGITSTVVLYDFLKKVGADVHYILPHRENDGYGLKDYFIRQFQKDGVKLLITVDCGTSNSKEVALANQLDIDVIITDHHTIPEMLPAALAIINPRHPECKYPNKEICGAGVAYKLVAALAPHYLSDEEMNQYLNKQLSLVALGLIADCVPLLDENRILTKQGLASLQAGSHPSVLSLLESAGISPDKLNSMAVGFYIGPRLNAAGRLDTPNHALELLLGDLEKIKLLNQLNRQRQTIVKKYLADIMATLDEKEDIPPIIIIYNPEWRVGTLGLIAGKITEHYQRPAIVMQDRGEELVASCRSVNDFDITTFLREETGDLFTVFGGHKLAGGFTLPKDNLDEFLQRIQRANKEYIDPNDFVNTLNIECEIDAHELNFETRKHLDRMEPFGNSNPEPILLIRNAKITYIRPVGKKGDHLQLTIKYNNQTLQAIAFRFGEHLDNIDPNIEYDIAFNLDINEWNGSRKLQLKVIDMRESNN